MSVLIRALGFLVIPVLYMALDWLNFVQAGKCALMGTLAILAVSSWTVRIDGESRCGRLCNLAVLVLFLVVMVFQAFLRDLFGVAHDDLIVTEALFSTNSVEAFEFLLQNGHYVVKHLGLAILVVWLYDKLLRRFDRSTPAAVDRISSMQRRQKKQTVIFTGLFLLVHLNPSVRRDDPFFYFPHRYAKWKKGVEYVRTLQESIATATHADPAFADLRYAGEGPQTVVFVIGESVTRLNWSLYGYARKTTPELEAMGSDLLRFNDVVTSDGSTVLSLEKMLTPATLDRPELWKEKPDLLTIARKAGYKTFWITNHGTDMNGVLSIFSSHADRTVNANQGGSRGEGSYDEVVLPHFADALDDPAPQKLIILHLLNAHPAYYFRYPKSYARFNNAKDAVTKELDAAGRVFWAIEMRNYYDNAMLYSDHILKRTIELCDNHREKPIAWLFASDHGEDVAHYNNFVGHNANVISMYEIPLLFWHTPSFAVSYSDPAALAARPYQTDQLDHTLLGLMRIEGDYYDPRRDIFSPVFASLPRRAAGKPYP